MRKIIINGGKKLQGEVTVSGAKNSVVALIPAIILSDGVVTLDGVPAISDVDNLIEIIEVMGGSVKRDGETLEIDPRGVYTTNTLAGCPYRPLRHDSTLRNEAQQQNIVPCPADTTCRMRPKKRKTALAARQPVTCPWPGTHHRKR